VILIVYVDKILLTGSDIDGIEKAINYLETVCGENLILSRD